MLTSIAYMQLHSARPVLLQAAPGPAAVQDAPNGRTATGRVCSLDCDWRGSWMLEPQKRLFKMEPLLGIWKISEIKPRC